MANGSRWISVSRKKSARVDGLPEYALGFGARAVWQEYPIEYLGRFNEKSVVVYVYLPLNNALCKEDSRGRSGNL